jgi:hypothetical protein
LDEASPNDWFPGDRLGLPVPAQADALKAGGAAYLTRAFRAAGALAADNAVTRITEFQEVRGGGTGRKLRLRVEYRRPEPGLPTDLFVKFSRDPDDPYRDDLRTQMESEVRFALLSRTSELPISVPKCLYADYHSASGTGVLITERIGFGQGGIEPAHGKCLDHQLPRAQDHYRAMLRAVARLSGAHKAGGIAARVAADFPLELDQIVLLGPIRYSEAQLQRRIDRLAGLVAGQPQLFAPHLASAELFDGLSRGARRFLQHQAEFSRFLRADHDMIALCHWNANVDNAWFWTAPGGELRCGLLDWGGVAQMPISFALYGCLSAAEPEVWTSHLDELLADFAAEHHKHGGAALDPGKLKLHLLLMTVLVCLAFGLEGPAIIEAQGVDLSRLESRFDPVLQSHETLRIRLHMVAMFLNVWQAHDLGSVIETFVADAAAIGRKASGGPV